MILTAGGPVRGLASLAGVPGSLVGTGVPGGVEAPGGFTDAVTSS